MSPKKRILRELLLANEPGTQFSYIRPADIPGYVETPDRYQGAVNELLKDRLIEGRKDDDGRMSIKVNEHRIGDVQRALRPLWARPAVWAAVAIVVVLGVRLVS